MQASDAHRVWVDVGGTFTDCFVVHPDGRRRHTKVLSSAMVTGQVDSSSNDHQLIDRARRLDPPQFWSGAKLHLLNSQGHRLGECSILAFESESGTLSLDQPVGQATSYIIQSPWEAPVLAVRKLLGIGPDQTLPQLDVRLGTTRGTNALLTRRGARTAFVTTAGFADLLEIGYQDRPELFDLAVKKRLPLYCRVAEVHERLDASGEVLKSLDESHARRVLLELQQEGIESIAICLLHAYKNPSHEQRLLQIAQELGMAQLSLSHVVAPLIKAVARGETTVIDAYLGPIIRAYLGRICDQLGGEQNTDLKVMTSAGGLVDFRAYQGKDSILSGPAGGVVAIGAIAKAAGFDRTIGFDMGGTSTDVYRHAGAPQLEYESTKANVRLMLPMLAIHTVAAGGGSVCWFDGIQMGTGPDSAGADPGPACYGRGGPLAITDLNVLLGRIDPSSFPFALNLQAAKEKLGQIDRSMQQAGQQVRSLDALADGFRRIANQTMAEAIRDISIAQGADPRQHALIGFGGAAGQHVCEVADLLNITKIIDPPEAGLLSALGMGLAKLHRSEVQSIYRKVEAISESELQKTFETLADRCEHSLLAANVTSGDIEIETKVEVRYAGTDQSLILDWNGYESLRSEFEREHQCRYGYIRDNRSLEIVAARCEAYGSAGWKIEPIESKSPVSIDPSLLSKTPLYCDGRWRDAWSVARDSLPVGARLNGPGRVLSSGSTTIVEPGWSMEVLSDRTLLLHRVDVPPSVVSTDRSQEMTSSGKTCDPVVREVIAQRVAAIARQMGIVLEQTAISVNIKERRDFSCAVFTAKGELIANAPHVPVHLGAMGATVREILRSFPEMQPGDCYVTNDPYRGGSHLPDITVVSPVFDRAGKELLFLVANRAHHAEVGGIAPGSMAPTSRRLGEEGVVLSPMPLVQAGRDRSDEVRQLFEQGRYPSRSVHENMADLLAQQAANRRGEEQLLLMVDELSKQVVLDYVEYVLAAAEEKVSRWIMTLGDRFYSFEDRLDDGTSIRVRIQANSGRLIVDFQGSGPVSRGNLNANPAIVTAATLYVVRCMVKDTLPLNAGVLRRLEIRVPEGILCPPAIEPPEDRAAVAAGNVETSQRIVDCLLGAFGVAGASQGTMNNFLFGDSSFGYYETICGGAGATADASGASAVHTHMTNTRLTDVEVLESRYPVRLTRFSIRRGSGGKGKHDGGDGIVREMEFLKPVEVSLVTGRRSPNSPYGAAGGQPGKSGENWHVRNDGTEVALGASVQLRVEAGERIRICTPGGGGFGESA